MAGPLASQLSLDASLNRLGNTFETAVLSLATAEAVKPDLAVAGISQVGWSIPLSKTVLCVIALEPEGSTAWVRLSWEF